VNTARVLGLAASVWVFAAPAHGAQQTAPDPLEAPRRDPNEAPFMKPPHGGAAPDGTRVYPAEHGPRWGHRHRVRLTLSPIYASVRRPFLGRSDSPLDPNRGGGAQFDVDVPVWRPIWLRLTGSYSGHRLPAAYLRNDDGDLQQTAAAGTLHIGHAAAALLYTMDRGRLQPTLELGLGPMWARTPKGVLDGQTGQACLGGSTCDFGLVCDTAQNVCRPAATFVVHGGAAVDVEMTEHLAVGLALRYFALLSDPQVYPVYLQAALRLGLRF
jgi:hypothetical protein